MIAGKIRVDALIEFSVARIPHIQRGVSAVILRQFLLDDIRFNRDAQVVGLPGQVRRNVIVLVLLERRIPQIAPQNRGHAKLMRMGKGLADFHDLPRALVGTEINRCSHRGSPHVVGLPHGPEEHLVKAVRIRQQLVVIDLHDKRDLVRVLARHGPKHAEGRSNRVASAFDGQLHDILAVEVFGVFCKACSRRVLDALVHRQDREITRARQAPRVKEALQTRQHTNIAVARRVNAVDKIRAGQMKFVLRNFRRLKPQQQFRFRTQIAFNLARRNHRSHFSSSPLIKLLLSATLEFLSPAFWRRRGPPAKAVSHSLAESVARATVPAPEALPTRLSKPALYPHP